MPERWEIYQSGRKGSLAATSAMRWATDPSSAELPNGSYAGSHSPEGVVYFGCLEARDALVLRVPPPFLREVFPFAYFKR